MKLIKLVVMFLSALVVALAVTFPKVAITLAIVWAVIGAVVFFMFTGRKNMKGWQTCDTFLLVLFCFFGPVGLMILKSNDPRL